MAPNTVTKKAIAEYLGISRTSVSLALNNAPNSTLSADMRKKIHLTAKNLGYRDTTVSPKICYILYERNENDPRYLADLQIFEQTASNMNYGLLFVNIRNTQESLCKLEKYLVNSEIEGFIISGDIDDKLIDLISHSNVPYIFYGIPEHVSKQKVNFLAFNEKKLTLDAIEYLFSLGHTRIAFFSGSLDYNIHQLNLEGYILAHEKNKIPLDKSLIQICSDENGFELCKRADQLKLHPTAIFCTNTIIQFGALQYLQSKGIAVPDEISLLGSGLSELVKISNPQLTTYYASSSEKSSVILILMDIVHNRGITETRSSLISNFIRFEGGTVTSKHDDL